MFGCCCVFGWSTGVNRRVFECMNEGVGAFAVFAQSTCVQKSVWADLLFLGWPTCMEKGVWVVVYFWIIGLCGENMFGRFDFFGNPNLRKHPENPSSGVHVVWCFARLCHYEQGVIVFLEVACRTIGAWSKGPGSLACYPILLLGLGTFDRIRCPWKRAW